MSLINCKTETTEPDLKAAPLIKTEQFQAILDTVFQAHLESVGISVHIESPKNNISWSGSVGYSNRDTKTKLLPSQPVLIASSIKTYVSAAVLRLQELGVLRIEDPIAKHLSTSTQARFSADGYDLNKIKIKHLLSHTSGIDDYVNDDYFEFINTNPKYRWTRDEQLALALKVGAPLGDPQALFKYADVNYLLATEIIEQNTKQPFYTAIRQLLKFKSLGFKHTWFPTLEDQPRDTKPLAHQYWRESDWGERQLNINWDSYEHDISWDLYGGGGIATTMKELAQFYYQLFNGNIITDKAVLDLIRSNIKTKDSIERTYRLGIADTSVKGLQSLGHGGFWGTIVFYIPQLDTSIAVCVLERKGKMKIIETVLNRCISLLTKQIHPFQQIEITDRFHLYKAKDAKATLVLFPGGADTAHETKNAFDVLTAAASQDVSVLFMNYNKQLWLNEQGKNELSKIIKTSIEKYQLNTTNMYFGGMSIGGNVALGLSDYLLRNKAEYAPKGTFIVDSPIDLYALYENALSDVLHSNFDDRRLEEPRWIINYFENKFGKDSILHNINKVSPFVLKTNTIGVKALKEHKLRFYTEPDSLWWKTQRQTKFNHTNAYTIQAIARELKLKRWNHFELIETNNKGFRANGVRHPHSWSIIDVKDLMLWIKK